MRLLSTFLGLALCAFGTGGHAQVNTVITDGTQSFAEGSLRDYVVQANGRDVCKNPVAYGRYIACSGRASKRVWVETNGTLGAYIVLDPSGRELCRNPGVYNQFRGRLSYIVCP